MAHVYEKKYDDVAVTRIDTVAAPELVDTDQAVKSALVQPVPFYTVRVKRKSEAKGLRYDFFVYQNGFWRTGNLLVVLAAAACAGEVAAWSAWRGRVGVASSA